MSEPNPPLIGNHIILVGMMGAGKSTAGKALARRLNLPFVDTDHLIIERTGVPINTIFEIEGEAGFRARESAVIASLPQLPRSVVATGGGAVLRAENRAIMKQAGRVVYLAADPVELVRRLRNDRTRPLLADAAPLERLRELLAQREQFYREVADIVIETRWQRVGRLVADLAAQLTNGHSMQLHFE